MAGDAARLAVRLTPRGGRDALEGSGVDASGRVVLRARVSAPPEGGRANAALIALLAKRLNLPRRALRIASGETARVKIIEIIDPPGALPDRLAALMRPAAS